MIKKAFTLFAALIIVSLLIYYFMPEGKLPPGITIDKIVVLKSNRHLLVYSKGKLIKIYKISLGFSPKGKKEFEKDGKTPEGLYFINNKNAHSVCYKSLGISYPNQHDKLNAKRAGLPADCFVEIHGLKNGRGFIARFHRWYDWTDGCIALTDAEVDELYYHVPLGTAIEIRS